MIGEKILNIMSAIGPIIKDKTNEDKGFDYASIAKIIIAAREEMIKQKVIIIPVEINEIHQNENKIIISMRYRFYDTEKNEKGENEYIDVNMPGEGTDSFEEGWAIYKALSGAYKYALTQSFAIPTVDDAEKTPVVQNLNNEENISDNNIISLDETQIEESFGETSINEFDKIFNLNKGV